MERGTAANLPDILGRYLALDENGSGLRATWRPAHGFTNLSLWRGEVCVAAFHLSAQQMGELIAFLGTSLATSHVAQPTLRVLRPSEAQASPGGPRGAWSHARSAAARSLDAIASRVRPQ